MHNVFGWTLGEWQAAYRSGAITPDILLTVATQYPAEDTAWIARAQPQALAGQLALLSERLAALGGDMTKLPLYGVPFAIKDNIDAAGWDTTAACPEFAYRATQDASVLQKLRAAGAILMGKTNLD